MENTQFKEYKGNSVNAGKVPVLNEAKPSEVNKEMLSVSSDSEYDNSEFILSRSDVESLGKAVHLVDSDSDAGLDLFCYVKCTNTDSELLKKCRGVVFHDDDLVMQAFPYTAEFNHKELPRLEEILKDFSKFSFYDAHEGALLRVFNFDGKWYLSTHRKLNAFRSKWSSCESYGTHFKNALTAEIEDNKSLRSVIPDGDNVLDRFYTLLDPKKQYMFLLLNNEDNRIVCQPPIRPTVYHVGTFINGKLDLDDNFLIPKPRSHHWLNIDEMIHYVDNCDYRKLQGVICFGPNNTQLKIFNKNYQDLFRARGNEASIKFRYLQVRMTKKFVDMLYHLYPNKADVFDDYENTLYDIARYIYKSYVQRFIKKNYVTVPREEFQVIKECHDWHLSDRENNRIYLEKVISVLNKQPPTSLNHMIRRFKEEQNKKKDEKILPRSYQSRNNSPGVVAANNSPMCSPLLLPKKGQCLSVPPPVLSDVPSIVSE